MENQPFSRTAVWLTQEATIDEALLVSVGVGGMFWYPLPAERQEPWARLINFGPGVHIAAATYNLGDVNSPWLRLKMGYFPHKYNPDARNLGEYLFRSGTYPGIINTGGWAIVNSASYGASGLLGSMSFLDDHLKLDVGVFMERDLEPNFDLSPSIVASYDFGGFLELGAGIVFAHLVPFVPEMTSPKNRRAAYYTDPATGKESPLPASQYNNAGLNDSPTADPSVSAVRPNGDSLIGQDLPAGHRSRGILEEKGFTAKYLSDSANGIPENRLSYYTFQGQKVMARAAIRPQKLLQSDLLGPNDLTLYGEVALLGIKDYPFYYEKKTERMPVMFGFNFPTFKLLDALTLEFEYHKMRFRNSSYGVFQNVLPVWDLGELDMALSDPQEWERLEAGQGTPARVAKFNQVHGDPNWWWSLFAKKTVVPGFAVHLQVARDHFRVIGPSRATSFEPIFHRQGWFDDYYWALKLEFGT
ncbi:MAG: hypothetical protein ABIW76_20660 [Fibrobacteria bacterium]